MAMLVFFHWLKNPHFPSPDNNNNKGSISTRTTNGFIFIPQHANETDLGKVEEAIVLDDDTNDENHDVVSPLAACHPTAQAKIAFTEPKWTLTTFDKYGYVKHMGGDEFYIVYYKNLDNATAVLINDNEPSREPTAVAFCRDHGDGNYTLDFSTTPMDPNSIATQEEEQDQSTKQEGMAGSLVVYFDYTCNIG
jgi:hypothetical protein